MKTIVRKETSESLYVLADAVSVTVSPDNIVVGNPPMYIIGDLNEATAVVYTDVASFPEDWTGGGKYLFDGADWTVNPLWFEQPELTEQPEEE